MSKALIVFVCAIQDMPNHRWARVPTAAEQITFAKSFEQRFGLIEPGGVRGREQPLHTRGEFFKEVQRVATDVTGTIIQISKIT